MISPDWCTMVARYNAWQNSQLRDVLQAMPEAELTRDRGAFFQSILGTASHLLWADRLWMSRFDGGPRPECGIDESATAYAAFDGWQAARAETDHHIRIWAEALRADDLRGDLVWYSGLAEREISKPVAQCVTHLFNHQTHHRGQIHAMLTAAGSSAPVSDLAFMPDAP